MDKGLVPRKGIIIVEIAPDYKYVVSPDKRHATSTSGRCVVGDDELIGKTVFYEEYKDGTQTIVDKKKYAFIKLDDVRGYSNDK